MKWVLIILLTNHPSAWSTSHEIKEVAIFPDKDSCLQAASKYHDNDHPVCGIKELKCLN